MAAERTYLATQSARVKGLPPMNVAKAMRPPPTNRVAKAKRRAQRPEWGQGHAGGARLKKDIRPVHSPTMGGWSPPAHAVRV